jgi:hypothetical protein
VKDPDSEVSRTIRERGGYQLMPEWETQPANHYLPRKVTEAPKERTEFRLGDLLKFRKAPPAAERATQEDLA